ncbi:hypothetical protein I302_105701 [Kwoniella bestiolae CBS 10118]|uniref:C2H2-type domain-containing protein n=1 Tax=Kwoniella bestiolae CBS 10118 TaxID=1296100 RepID=A0A1B9G1X2_9TREE|nr:hypothetical protein I302_04821 [Kwoniella bestiolae CBS 10118]OCF25011.1 hypothetical protein I302_04821 [Kwoniella bestiolae CBS 10118]
MTPSPTPTPTSPQAQHSPQLITPQVKLVKSKSPPHSKAIKLEATSPNTPLPPISMVTADTSARLQTRIFNQSGLISPSAISPKAKPPSPNRKKMSVRRQSRFDPMMAESEDTMMEDEGYGDLGLKHPLRRVKEEEMSKENKITPPESISLPPIKSLFGVASDHPQTPSSSSSLFQSPSLPSLIPNSPSGSPSSARTSRYSSLTSSAVPENSAGWWAPEFEKGLSPFQPTPYRSNSFPTIPYVSDETGQKRRRSDGPPALRDAEESARLRWQAQSRNASFPMATSPGPHTAGPSSSNSSSSSGLRSLLHPPQASSAGVSASMSRSSFSGSTTGGRLSPTLEDEPLPFSRRPSQASRNPSLVGGQLSNHFAGLSASDRDKPVSSEMPPPLQTAPPSDRRGSAMLPPLSAMDDNRLLPPPSSLSRSASPASDIMRRQSLTRPPSPDVTGRPELRRSSLTEIIMQKSGDMNMAMTPNRFGPSHPHANELGLATSVSMDKSSFSEPVPPLHSAPAWTSRRESTDSIKSHHDDNGAGPLLSLRGRKRSVVETQQNRLDDDDAEMTNSGDPGMRGMEVLLAAAAVEEERKVRKSSEEDDDRDTSPLKMNGVTGNGGPNGGPKYTCAFCAKTFSRPSSLRIHTYSHTGERPYVCKEPTCRRRFSVQSNLKRHAKVHQLGAAALQQHNGHPHGPPGLAMPHHGHPAHPGMPRAPHSHPGTVSQGPPGPHGQMYHPPPPGYYPPPPPPGYPHPHAAHYGAPPGPPGYGPPPPHVAMGMPPPHQGPGWRSVSSSRRTSRDEDASEGEEEGEEEDEEIDELDED